MPIGSVTGVTGNAVVAEHLFHGNLARTSTLVGDVLNEVGVACQGVWLSFAIAQKYEKIRKSSLCLNCGMLLCLFCFYYFDIQLFNTYQDSLLAALNSSKVKIFNFG